MPNDQVRILFLAANPETTPGLQLSQEFDQVRTALAASRYSQRFRLERHWHTQGRDLIALLSDWKPHILHFSGHGHKDGSLITETHKGPSYNLGAATLAEILQATQRNLHLVTLNACYSERTAQHLRPVVDYVVGMETSVSDAAAIEFARVFYRGLFAGESIGTAYDQGRAQLKVSSLPGPRTPQILSRSDAKDPRLSKPLEDWIDFERAAGDGPAPASGAGGRGGGRLPRGLARPAVRALLDKHLPVVADLEKFILDYFPAVHVRFGQNWMPVQMQNLLFQYISTHDILERLEECLSVQGGSPAAAS